MQRPAPRPAIERVRLRERQFRLEIHPGFDNVIARPDARDAIADYGLAGRFASGDLARDRGRGQFVERTRDLGVHGQFFPARPAEVPAILPKTVPDISPEPPG